MSTDGYWRIHCSLPLQESFTAYPDPSISAVVVYMAGCDHACPGCQNPELQSDTDAESVTLCSAGELAEYIRAAAYQYRTDKVVLMGGDPLSCSNRDATRWLCATLSGEFDICIYTGYTASEVQLFDITGYTYIKTGRYDASHNRQSFKNDRQMVLASPNQEFYNGSLEKVSKQGIITFKKVS